MSTVVYVSQTQPEKGLEKVIKLKGYLSADQKKEIIKQIEEQLGSTEDYVVTMHVEIELKKYDTKDTRVR